MDKVPMLLYDSVALLAPGSILVALLAWVYPITVLQQSMADGRIIMVLLLAYGTGHLLQAAGTLLFGPAEHRAIQHAWDEYKPQKRLLSKLASHYGDVGHEPKGIERLCLGPLQDKLHRRHSFVTAADFNRAMITAMIIALLPQLAHLRGRAFGWDQAMGLVVTVVSVPLFYHRYHTLRKYGASAAYSAFTSMRDDNDHKLQEAN